jgi:hypothetical protein
MWNLDAILIVHIVHKVLRVHRLSVRYGRDGQNGLLKDPYGGLTCKAQLKDPVTILL